LIFQDSIKISTQFKNKIKDFFIKEKINFKRKNGIKRSNEVVNFLNNKDDETENQNKNSKFKSNVIVDPDKISKNFSERHQVAVKLENFKLDLESFKKYIYEKYTIKPNIYQKLLITEYLNIFIKDGEMNQSEIKSEFENIYNKFVIDKKKGISITDVDEDNSFSNNGDLDKIIKYLHVSLNNITSVIEKTKNPYIILSGEINNNYAKNFNSSKIKKNNIKISKNNTLGQNHSLLNETKNKFNSSLNTDKNLHSQEGNSEKNSDDEMDPNMLMQDLNAQDLNLDFINPTNSTNTTSTLQPTKHNFTQPLDKKKRIHDMNSPVLKNEKIRYVNGSLIVVQTLMIPSKDEALDDVKKKFLNILQNGLK
jgi:hypothetical protein